MLRMLSICCCLLAVFSAVIPGGVLAGTRSLDQGGDVCTSATVINSLPYCDTGTTFGYADNYSVPAACSQGTASGLDVVYSYTPIQTETISLSLCGSSYNTVIHVWQGCPPNGTLRCCNDDFCGLQSCCTEVTVALGSTYYIIVDGAAAGDSGEYVLSVSYESTCEPCPCPYPNRDVEPDNNTCATVLCTQPVFCGDTLCGEIGVNAVGTVDVDWYCLQVPGPECVRIGLDVYADDRSGWYPFGKGLDSRLELYAANCVTLLGSNDDIDPAAPNTDSHLASDCLQPGFYFVRISSTSKPGINTVGPYVLVVQCAPCDCCQPDSVIELPFCWEHEIVIGGDTRDAGDDCDLRPSQDQIWKIFVPRPCMYSFSLCDSTGANGPCAWDSYIYLTTHCCDRLSIVAENDNCLTCPGLSAIPCTYLAAGVYYLIVEGHLPTDAGPYWLTIDCCAPCNITYDELDHGDPPQCSYPTFPLNPAHGLSGVAWLGATISGEPGPNPSPIENPTDDGVVYHNWPWTPCTTESVTVFVTAGPNYVTYYNQCCGCLFLNGWKDGNYDGDFCDTLCVSADGLFADEWIVQDVPVLAGSPSIAYTFLLKDPGVFNLGTYPGVFRWRLTSQPVGRRGFGGPVTACPQGCLGTYAVDPVGEVEDYFYEDFQLAVELTGFDAVPGDGEVLLHWSTASETDNDRFEISRNGTVVGQIPSLGNGTSAHSYEWTDSHLVNGTTYHYKLWAVDMNGGRQELSTADAAPLQSGTATVSEYTLYQNYPNPFNPSTDLTFDLKDAGQVRLEVFDMLGRNVQTLVDGSLDAGRHTVTFRASGLPSGIYFYRLQTVGFTAQRKMLLMK